MQRRHSRRGSWFGKKEDLKLTPEQKRRSKMTAKVDPTKAITEEEPFAVSQSKVGDTIRTLQHKDVYGNPIVEPDLSNPTRYRWERPLETIRSFEAAINKDLRRQSAFSVVDRVDSMDQSQKQVHHNSGPFDPSLYHRNNGAQRYAPVDAYSRDVYSRNGSGYYYHGRSSQDSFDRQVGPHISRQHSLRSNPQALMEQIPPLSHINSFGQPGQEGHSQFHGPRRAPEAGLKLRGYAAAPGNVQDHYNYNSDPNSESSSFGGSNKTSAHGYDVNFGDVSLQLELSNQLDEGMPPGNGNPYTDGYSNPVEDQSRNPYRNSAMSSIQSRNPYRNSTISPSQSQFPNTGHAGNTEFSGNSPIIGSEGGHTSSGDMGKKAVPTVPAKITPPAPVTTVFEPEIKKKKGLLGRLSKT